LEFLTLAAPSQVAESAESEVEVSFLIGLNSCWKVESLGVAVNGDVVEIDGNGIFPGYDPEHPISCLTSPRYGLRTLIIPGLPPGEYVVRAGDLQTTLEVAGDTTGPPARFTGRVRFRTPDDGCEGIDQAYLVVVLSELPAGLLPHVEYLVHGDISRDPVCGVVDPAVIEKIDHFVVVREVLPVE
jgi:hypothetical protein